jgi:hypothetical protein
MIQPYRLVDQALRINDIDIVVAGGQAYLLPGIARRYDVAVVVSVRPDLIFAVAPNVPAVIGNVPGYIGNGRANLDGFRTGPDSTKPSSQMNFSTAPSRNRTSTSYVPAATRTVPPDPSEAITSAL